MVYQLIIKLNDGMIQRIETRVSNPKTSSLTVVCGIDIGSNDPVIPDQLVESDLEIMAEHWLLSGS